MGYSMSKKPRTFTLKQRFIIFFTGGLLSVVFLILLVISKELEHSYTQLFNERGEHAVDELVYQTAKLFHLGLSPEELSGYHKLLMESLKKNEGVIYAALLNEKHQVLYNAGTFPKQHPLSSKDILNLNINSKYQIMGEFKAARTNKKWIILVILDQNLITKKTSNFIQEVAIYSAIVSILIIIALTLFLRINLGRPVDRLIEEIQAANLDNLCEFDSKLLYRGDELGMIARTFVKLMKSLGSSQQSLADANHELQELSHNLEARVESRTKEIESINDKLKILAHIDPLTGLLNRFSFEQDLLLRFQVANNNQLPFIIMVADLNGFKAVNDTFGHDAGDHTLKTIGYRIIHHFQYGHCVYRIGGDELVVIFEGNFSNQQLTQLVLEFRSMIIEPINYEGEPLPFGVSVGVATSESCIDSTAKQILQHADRAMYEAKAKGIDFVIKHKHSNVLLNQKIN